MSNKIYQMVTDRILEELSNGVIPWKKPWKDDGSLPTNLISKKPYRGMNLFLLPSNYETNYFLTFNQCKKLGGNVIKGEKSHPVVFWKFFNQVDKAGEDTGKSIPMLRYYRVFNIAQCAGIDEKKIPAKPELNDLDPILQCEDVVFNMQNKPLIQEGEARAYYSPSKDLVNMPKKGLFDSIKEWYATLFHELGHSTGHENRLNRDGVAGMSHGFGSQKYSKEELIAEMTASFLCGYCNIENDVIKNSASYISGWMSKIKNDPKILITSAGKAQRAADYILGISFDK